MWLAWRWRPPRLPPSAAGSGGQTLFPPALGVCQEHLGEDPLRCTCAALHFNNPGGQKIRPNSVLSHPPPLRKQVVLGKFQKLCRPRGGWHCCLSGRQLFMAAVTSCGMPHHRKPAGHLTAPPSLFFMGPPLSDFPPPSLPLSSHRESDIEERCVLCVCSRFPGPLCLLAPLREEEDEEEGGKSLEKAAIAAIAAAVTHAEWPRTEGETFLQQHRERDHSSVGGLDTMAGP